MNTSQETMNTSNSGKSRGRNSFDKRCRMIGIIALIAASATAFGDPPSAPNVSETSVGTTVGSFSELNKATKNTAAVFVYLPNKGGTGRAPLTAMKGAVRTIESKGSTCGIFTLKPGSSDYDQITAKMSLPAVLAMVKGGGRSTISGEITETKLIQGYVAASRTGCGPSAGGCGPSAGDCGPSGCK